jgi:hypothetical protein
MSKDPEGYGKVNPHPTPRGVWTCQKCHWQNPGICKDCGNCGKPRKEKP